MRHGRRGRALNMDGHQSRPLHHKLSLPLASMRRGVAGTIKSLTCGAPKASPPLTPPTAMRQHAVPGVVAPHAHVTHGTKHTHTRGARGWGEGSGGGGENVQRAVSAASEKKRQPRQSAPKGAGDPGLTQALAHGRRGPHTWALGDCCTLGRCPSTHTPHTTPHAHTLGQHIGYEEGHPPTQGPHQQSMSRETGAGRWEEVGVHHHLPGRQWS